MRTILLPVGPPGAGKSTLCNGLQQFMRAVARPCSVGNIDPANENIPYEAAFDVRELVDVEEVMEREELGPNGGVLWAMEEVEANLEWLEKRLEECGKTAINHFKCPWLTNLYRRDDYPRSSRPARTHYTSHSTTKNTATA